MKRTIKYLYEIYKQTIDNSNFTLVFLLSILFSIFAVFGIAYDFDYLNGFFSIFWNLNYNNCLLLLVLLNTINIYKIFKNNEFFVIRLNTKKKYLTNLVQLNCFSTLILILLNVILIVIFLNLFNQRVSIFEVKNYYINGWLYAIFLIIKLILLTQLFSMLDVLLLNLFNNKIVVVLNMVWYFIIMLFQHPIKIISSFTQISLIPSSYFGYQEYSSFIFEILCFCLYCSLLYLMLFLLKKIVLKRKKGVFET